MGGGIYTDFKSSNRIEISQISSSAIEFWMILGVPPGGAVVGGWGWGVVRGCTPPTFTCTCMHAWACTCTHMHTCMHIWHHREFPGIPQWGWPFAWNYQVYHACMCMHACTCMCTCVRGTPNYSPPPNHPPPPYTHPPPPEPQGAQNTKIQ